MSALANVLFFFIYMLFTLASFVLWIRIGTRLAKISALNPTVQSIYSITNPIVEPIARLFPKHFLSNRYDWGAFVTLILLILIKFILLVFILYGQFIPVSYLIALTIADLIIQPCNMLFYAIIIRVIISWFLPSSRNPFIEIIYFVTEPFLSFFRKLLPDFGGLDFSPILAIFILKAITILIHGLVPIKNII